MYEEIKELQSGYKDGLEEIKAQPLHLQSTRQ